MAIAVNVLYPVSEGSRFDTAYYGQSHMKLVAEHWGKYFQSCLGTRGDAGGPDTPPKYHATATIVFPDQSALDAAMQNGAEVMADIPNFTNVTPEMLIGEVFA